MCEEPPRAKRDFPTEQLHLDTDERVEKIVNVYVSQDNLTVYQNPWVVERSPDDTQQDTARGQRPPVPSDPTHVEHTTASFRAAVALGLTCFLLLTVIIGNAVQFKRDINQLRAEMIDLKVDRERLNATNFNLSKEMEELQLQHVFDGTVCANDWRCLGNSCYCVSKRRRKWKEAGRKCKNARSHLLVVNSNEEQKFILTLIPEEKGPVWMGLSTDDNGDWLWVDGTPLSPQHNLFQDNWQSDMEETSGMDRRCGAIASHDHQGGAVASHDYQGGAVASHDHQGGWNASPCDDEMFWMCERKRGL